MGKGGTSAPSLSATADNVNHRLMISQADKGLNWNDVKVSWDAGGATVYVNLHRVGQASADNITTKNGQVTGVSADIQGGDYIDFSGTSGTTVTVTLTYAPTNTNWGTWTIYL